MRLVIMGTPGAGKGTQAKMLAARFAAPHISTGDMFREAVHKGSHLGKEAKRYLDQGLLVPDDVVVGLVEERLDAPDAASGFILDGFPRTVAQAQALDAMLERRGTPLTGVVLLEVPGEQAVARLAARRVCRACGLTTDIESQRCARCNGELGQRDDDRADTVRLRMDVYGRETAPVVDYYRRTKRLRSVMGVGTRDAVFARTVEALA